MVFEKQGYKRCTQYSTVCTIFRKWSDAMPVVNIETWLEMIKYQIQNYDSL